MLAFRKCGSNSKYMKKLLLFTFISLFIGVGISQTNPPKYIAEARKSYESGKFHEALPKLEAAYNKMTAKGKSITEKGEMAFLVAECYRHMEQYDKASQWYASSVELKYYEVKPMLYYYHGEMLRMMGDFDNAKKSYVEYKKRRGSEKRIDIESLINSCDISSDFHSEESKFVVKHEEKLNAKEFDMAPFISDKKEGQIFYGTQREAVTNPARDPITGEKFMDIWIAEFDAKGDFISAKSADINNLINTNDNEGTAFLDRKGKTLFFTRCPSVPKQNLGCDIWMADRNGEDWDNVQKILIDKKGDSVSIGHPCVTADGTMLIFASNMPGGLGGKDLWYVLYDKKAKVWGPTPINMGSTINTAGNELFPSLSPSDSNFYFASDGHPGIGGLDIFQASIAPSVEGSNAKQWNHVRNMMKPINSIANDYALTIRKDLKSGFFTSERQVNKNKSYTPDIYSFTTPPVTYDLRVIVYELGNRNKKIEGSKVTVNEVDFLNWEGVTDAKGKTEKWASRKDKSRYINGGRDYVIKASKERYFPMARPTIITTKGPDGKGVLDQTQSFIVEIPLIPIELRTPEIRYHLDKWTFVKDNTINSDDSLLFLVNLLKDNPDIIIELYSHTDSRDTDIHNNALSSNRAKAVYCHLVDKNGIDPRRIIPFGKGETEPAKIMDENGVEQLLTDAYINQFKGTPKFEQLHQINRRTTVKIVLENGTENPKLFDASTAEPANPDFKIFVDPLPR